METAEQLPALARLALEQLRDARLKVATAESCTGGLIAQTLTSEPGSSEIFERGFVTYSNESKHEVLGVPAELIAAEGAVSAPVAAAMAQGALNHSLANAAVAVTGIAGPGGGSAKKPVGLVYIAVALKGQDGAFVEEFRFGDLGRDGVRAATAIEAITMLLGYALPEN
jgi:nicotinamide-nucleotide amidase